MHYFGGKARIAAKIAEAIGPCETYYEPFVGGGWVLARVKAKRRLASDANLPLINLWRALMAGWQPPENVSEVEYAEARTLPDDDPRKAFIAIGCSFSGKWFGGYARDNTGRNYASNAKNSLLRKVSALTNTFFEHASYEAVSYASQSVVYCDPPYQGMTGYGATGAFDWVKFWAFFQKQAERGVKVFVSEYAAPVGWKPALTVETKTDIRTTANGKEARIENLWVYRG